MEYQLNTLELASYMLKDPFIRQQYGGVLAIDQLPIFVQKTPKIFIVNTDISSKPGTHWFVMYVTGTCEHFDPAGLPTLPASEQFLTQHSKQYLINTQRVQDYDTYTCGLFCLFYSFFRCRGFSFVEIMQMFHENLAVNAEIVKHFYKITK